MDASVIPSYAAQLREPWNFALLLLLSAGTWFACAQTARLSKEGFFRHVALLVVQSGLNPSKSSREKARSVFVDEWEGRTHMSCETWSGSPRNTNQ